MYASVQQAEALNQKQSAPRWGVGIDVVPVEALPAFSFIYRDLTSVQMAKILSCLWYPYPYPCLTSVTLQNQTKQTPNAGN